jgi:hypothetical protein
MKRFMLAALLASGLGLATSTAQPGSGREDIPSDPIAPVSWHGWSNVIVLANRQVEVTILPAAGRIAGLRYGGLDNVLRFDTNLAVWAATHPATDDNWRNFGGDWLWPVCQAHWTARFGRHWPPQTFIDGQPWQARAWSSDDGSQTCLLRMDVGAPLFVTITRRIRLDPEQALLTIRQRIERAADSDVPMALWNISQIAAARRVVFPVDTDAAFPDGFRILDFGPPPAAIIDRCPGDVIALDVLAGTEHKLGSGSPRGWVAAQREGVLIVEQAESRTPGGAYPDGGCRIEVYANSGLGYTEIETLSEERVLAAGESLENTLTVSLHRAAPDLSACDLVARLRELIGETPPARPPSP